MVVRVLRTTQNLVISRCYFAEDGKEMYNELKRRAQPLFCSLNLLFGDIPVAVAVVAFLKSLVRFRATVGSFSSPEAALLLVSTKNRDLWPGPTTFRF